jgi:hypothetical protein
MTRRTLVRLMVATVIGIPAAAAGQGGPPGGARPRWGQDVEKEFKVGRGLGPKLMTEEEWKEHHRKMQTLSGDERDRYRREMHEQMRERAKERGIAMPAEPGPHGGRGGGPGGPPKR